MDVKELEEVSKFLIEPMSKLFDEKFKHIENQIASIKNCVDDRTNPDKVRNRWQSWLAIASLIFALVANFRPYITTATLVNKPDVQVEQHKKGATHDSK